MKYRQIKTKYRRIEVGKKGSDLEDLRQASKTLKRKGECICECPNLPGSSVRKPRRNAINLCPAVLNWTTRFGPAAEM